MKTALSLSLGLGLGIAALAGCAQDLAGLTATRTRDSGESRERDRSPALDVEEESDVAERDGSMDLDAAPSAESEDAEAPGPDSGVSDARPEPDARAGPDAGRPDADSTDATRSDAQRADAISRDAMGADAARIDAGCTPTRTCAAVECGWIDDGCGRTLSCPGCAAPETCGGGGVPNHCGGCQSLRPDPNADTNRLNIQACLDRRGSATLNPGDYPIHGSIHVRSNKTLLGAGGYPRLRMVANGDNSVISVEGDGSRVGFLEIDASNALPGTCCDGIIGLTGSNNLIDDVNLHDAAGPLHGRHTTGIYLINPSARNNQILRADIHESFYGVIFVAGLPSGSGNTIDHGRVHGNKCDGVTFGGFGRVVGVNIYENGFDCENGPIPGAAIYALGNRAGAAITGSELHDNCGNNLDLVDSSGFSIEENHIHDPGNQWGGTRSYCRGGVSALLVGVSSSTIRHNTITNSNRPWNTIAARGGGDWWRASGAAPFSDLPGGGGAVIAFLLARDRGGTPVMGNTIDNNVLQSFCTGGCTGVGYFTTRGTGFDAAGGWSTSTTNYFTANNPIGSQVGSGRCGGNWFAAGTSCSNAPPANTDDCQHTGPGHDWKRADACDHY